MPTIARNPASWVIYRHPAYENDFMARQLVCYGVVAMDLDDTPGRMVPFVASIINGLDGVLRPIYDDEFALGVVRGAYDDTDAIALWTVGHESALV